MISRIAIYELAGMTCGHCVQTIQRAAAGTRGVLEASVDQAANRLRVRLSEDADAAAVVVAVEAAGYGATPAEA